jgi:hypothetical protein
VKKEREREREVDKRRERKRDEVSKKLREVVGGVLGGERERERIKKERSYDQLSPASGCSSPSPCVSDVQRVRLSRRSCIIRVLSL